MFREDSQIDFAKENFILNVSLRPSQSSACTFHLKSIVSLCVNYYMYLLKIPSKIKPMPVGLCYQTAFIGDRERDFGDRNQASLLYKPIVSLCVNYLLKIKSKIKPRPVGLCYTSGVYGRSGTSLY